MPEEIFETRRPRWVSVARIANQRTGRHYSGVYCREVATGYRTNSKLEPILRELGVMQGQIPSLTATEEAVAA